ncbi:MAG: peptidoglycan DD-metalloendopeptidase family protein [Acidimicrobiales bacterium]
MAGPSTSSPPLGTPVCAAGAAGFATDITGKPGGSGFGNVVRADHGRSSTIYAHLAGVAIDHAGEWVDETTVLGMVGSTGLSSTPHVHYERVALPNGATSVGQEESVDPGPLFACRAGFLVAFPEVAGLDSWKGLAWGSLTVANDGPDCLGPAEAAPAAPVPAARPWSSVIAPRCGSSAT